MEHGSESEDRRSTRPTKWDSTYLRRDLHSVQSSSNVPVLFVLSQ
jgi:hypothetical protein